MTMQQQKQQHQKKLQNEILNCKEDLYIENFGSDSEKSEDTRHTLIPWSSTAKDKKTVSSLSKAVEQTTVVAPMLKASDAAAKNQNRTMQSWYNMSDLLGFLALCAVLVALRAFFVFFVDLTFYF